MLASFPAVPLLSVSDVSPSHGVGYDSQDKLRCDYEQAQPKPPMEPVKTPSALGRNDLFPGVSELVRWKTSPGESNHQPTRQSLPFFQSFQALRRYSRMLLPPIAAVTMLRTVLALSAFFSRLPGPASYQSIK